MPTPIKIFVSYARKDARFWDELSIHLAILRNQSLIEPWYDGAIDPGQDWKAAINKQLQQAQIILLLVSPDFLNSEYIWDHELKQALERHERGESRVIPILLRPAFWQNTPLGKIQCLPRDAKAITQWSDRDEAYVSVVQGINRAIEELINKDSVGSLRTKDVNSFLIKKVILSNIRCFSEVEIDLEQNGKIIQWAMLLGDNAVGKSTLLRSIAIGLSDEATATALIKSIRGDFVRRGAQEGTIEIHLCHNKEPNIQYQITTRIVRGKNGNSETVRQTVESLTGADQFSHSKIFVCGYGTQRSRQATASFDEYQISDAVATLFDEQNGLQNPELFLLRRDQLPRRKIIDKILPILLLDQPGYDLELTDRGLEITGPWGKELLDSLSDGYRSTTQWILDLVSWLILSQKIRDDFDDPDLSGIILIDEIEQHLHPLWQRNIVQKLNGQFPGMQFITTTHTPLIAAGIVDVENSVLLKLEQKPDGSVTVRPIDKSVLRGRRADQILTSEAFDLITTKNKGSEDDLDRFSELLGKTDPNAQEDEELAELRAQLQQSLQIGETELERTVEKAVKRVLEEMVHSINPELLDFETKKQLKELFRPRE